jgi:hypothetical protein
VGCGENDILRSQGCFLSTFPFSQHASCHLPAHSLQAMMGVRLRRDGKPISVGETGIQEPKTEPTGPLQIVLQQRASAGSCSENMEVLWFWPPGIHWGCPRVLTGDRGTRRASWDA